MWSWRFIPFPIPQSWGDNLPWDLVRAGAVVLGVVLVLTVGRVMRESHRRQVKMSRTQIARFLGLIPGIVYVAWTELSVAGTPASPRLLFGLAYLAGETYGVAGMRRKQRRNPPA